MAGRGRRRRISVGQPLVVDEQESTPSPPEGESEQAPSLVVEDTASASIENPGGELDMSEVNKEEEVKRVSAPEPKAASPKVRIALGRCRYTGRGGLVVSERGETLKDPVPRDLADLEAEGLVGYVDAEVADALGKLKEQDPAALRTMLGM